MGYLVIVIDVANYQKFKPLFADVFVGMHLNTLFGDSEGFANGCIFYEKGVVELAGEVDLGLVTYLGILADADYVLGTGLVEKTSGFFWVARGDED